VSSGFNVNWMSFTLLSAPALRTYVEEETTNAVSEHVIKISPNPASNSVTITINNDYRGSVKISVLNSTGQRMKAFELSKTTQKFEVEMNVSDLVHGFYVVSINADKFYTEKLIKQ
jgi:Secretion system C-terminal sorting domain